ncbi:putative cyclic nucleotide-gated ion channel 15 [Camellia lanceoleosa]|uniref:Cyclic nucleotide-gated ion channel 15 n=1 Tax=Camellia lanceoleosa TaxID=1840588 RepID=A0ACC0HKG7_9ERIC|nr:putative cyclic nucleotide-gated ion channel 15 [Camellia lanceoleosa]
MKQVPLFNQIEEHIVDGICEHLKPVLCSSGTCLVQEGDSANDMLFIIHGHLDSSITNGGQVSFFNSSILSSGDFCGEELLTWALDPHSTSTLLPFSTSTVKAISQVEAFALASMDVKFVASKFRRLHRKEMKHVFRCHLQH